jgi:hypothetical protein
MGEAERSRVPETGNEAQRHPEGPFHKSREHDCFVPRLPMYFTVEQLLENLRPHG